MKIVSAEDPVEIEVPGVSQMSANPRAGILLQDLIHAALRADPDVLMIGEIRDEITADLAARVARSDHLVLTSMHSKKAHHALQRLRQMTKDISIADFPPTFIFSQRLARRLCSECGQTMEPSANEQRMIKWVTEHNGLDVALLGSNFRAAVGCEQCKQGYKGRVGCYESLVLDRATRELLKGSPSEEELWRAANAGGTISLEFNLIRKVSQGLSTLDEFYRITDFNSDDWNEDLA